jgi:hypothetical protein
MKKIFMIRYNNVYGSDEIAELLKFNFRKAFTYALCLNEIGADIVQKFIGREPSGRIFNEIALDYNGNESL